MNAFCIFMHPKRALLQIERLESDLFAEKETNRTVIAAQRQALMKMRAQLQEKNETIADLKHQMNAMEEQVQNLTLRLEEQRDVEENRMTLKEIEDEWLNGKVGSDD